MRRLTMAAWAMLSMLPAAAVAEEDLSQGFATPPAAARPWVYWFPLSGNLTKEGITADLEAMARVGIGGVLYMEVDQGAPVGPADFAGPKWRELFAHACREAHRLGLEINMNNDAGWCGSGGPWITPELSMQKVVWSQQVVDGGRTWSDMLPKPPAVRDFYRDIAVLAFPAVEGDGVTMAQFAPKFATSGNAAKNGRFTLPKPAAKQPQSITITLERPFAARHLTASLTGKHNVHGTLDASDDGKTFRPVHTFVARAPALAVDFDAVTAKCFRVTFTRADDPKSSVLAVANVELSPQYVISNPAGPHKPAPAGMIIAREKIVDLTTKLDASGKLAWDVPPGRWTILRFGSTTTGKDNHPSPASGRGLECDKLSKEAATVHFENLMGRLIAENKDLAGQGKTLVSTHIDSWEVGTQNWTPRMREEFRRLRGYDIIPMLPALCGRVVDSVEVTRRFHWDLAQTVSDLIVENYAGEIRRLANKHGLRLSIEAYGEPAEDMTYAGQADEPMSEFWQWAKFSAANSCTEMASAAHTYGKPILGAEAFTSTNAEKWQSHPGNIKDLGDWAFCEGVNRFVFHRYAAQPWTNPDRAPGMSMGPWGLHYERTQTWWEQSKAWHEYLARCQYLLQRGRFVADVVYLVAEGAPRNFGTPAGMEIAPHVRGGYNFDGCTPEVVLTRMTVRDGRIVLPDGMTYRVLVLPSVETMTPRLVKKIQSLVDAGATVVAGPKPPQASPSLTDLGDGDAEVKRVADALWAGGRLITDKTAVQFLAAKGVPPDFRATSTLRYIHRTIDGAEVYFVANPEPAAVDAVATFRVAGRQPEFWWPDTGRVAPAMAFDEHDGVTSVPLRLEPSGSVFVVFRHASKPAERIVSIQRDGRELLPQTPTEEKPAAAAGPDAVRSFTIAAWVKPAADTTLGKESNAGTAALHAPHNDVVYAAPGHEVWTEADAGAGLAVGRNGVCVHEHGSSHFPAVLVYPATISDWTHVAVVYRDGTPSLYVDGKLVRTGLKSHFTVHGSLGARHARHVRPYQGQVDRLRQFDHALSDAEIARLVAERPRPSVATAAAVDIARGEILESGQYVIQTAGGAKQERNVSLPAAQEIAGPWQVAFDPKSGGPAGNVTFDKLVDWSKHADNGIRYYSGTAVYRTTFRVAATGAGQKTYLDLGNVAVMAEVVLNGRNLGTLWKPPYRVDVTAAIKAGDNAMELRVVNLWINRQIGDEQLPEDSDRNAAGTLKSWPQWLGEGKPSPTGRFTFGSWRLWKKDDPLVESGLLGPVTLQAAQPVRE